MCGGHRPVPRMTLGWKDGVTPELWSSVQPLYPQLGWYEGDRISGRICGAFVAASSVAWRIWRCDLFLPEWLSDNDAFAGGSGENWNDLSQAVLPATRVADFPAVLSDDHSGCDARTCGCRL